MAQCSHVASRLNVSRLIAEKTPPLELATAVERLKATAVQLELAIAVERLKATAVSEASLALQYESLVVDSLSDCSLR